MLARTALRAAQIGLAIVMVAYLLSFADHARQILGFPHPLDYGEGPLLAQVDRLRAGTPIWQLYRDPSAPPYAVVNYPPLYLLLCAGLAALTGSALLAGRLISLISALAAVAAIAVLTGEARKGEASPREKKRNLFWGAGGPQAPARIALSLLLLTIPIVREWAALMRVDLLGISLGLWGLVALGRPGATRRPALAGLLLLACLFTKPSLLAAPAAAGLWLLVDLREPGRAGRGPQLRAILALGGTITLGGGLLFGLLQLASGGWFSLHVVTANANRWDAGLAQGFWQAQAQLRWPLAAAALVSLVAQHKALRKSLASDIPLAPALLYTLCGAITAAGVGKVGAYSNYFLELYIGLVWIVASRPRLSAITTVVVPPAGRLGGALPLRKKKRGFFSGTCGPQTPARNGDVGNCNGSTLGYRLSIPILLIASMITYPPLWDPTWPRQAGLVAPSPPRLAFGRYGLWQDARREGELLAAFDRADVALEQEVRAAGSQVFTDMPGIAAGVGSRMQVFEARQLLDQGLASQAELLADLADGRPPLAVIDYLGNWLTPEIIAVLRHRYAQDGAIGTFDLYRPVDAGPAQAVIPPARLGAGLDLVSYALAAPLSTAYEPGELLTIALHWRPAEGIAVKEDVAVVVQLTTPGGLPLRTGELPLVYGALPPDHWPAAASVQHLQTLALPDELPPGRYRLAVELRVGGAAIGPIQQLAEIEVRGAGGITFAETGYFVPAPIMRAWAELGGVDRAGLPLTPAVPFAWGRLQCFERTCLELRAGQIQTRPLGAQLYLTETIRSAECPGGALKDGICAEFQDLAEPYGQSLGIPISGELLRNGWQAQWTTAARLERRTATGEQGLGRLGEESLRLPPGERYRWP
ncbi:MAG: hypothetical protein WCJ55_11855 [Chloroflexales bacterium]